MYVYLRCVYMYICMYIGMYVFSIYSQTIIVNDLGGRMHNPPLFSRHCERGRDGTMCAHVESIGKF